MKKIKILLLGILLIWPQQLFAAVETEFTPSISISETYDDNIDLDRTDEDKKDDWITSISPGITFNVTSQKNSFSLNYSPSFVRYNEMDENDTTRHAFSFSSNIGLSQHLEFNISDTYLKSEEPIEEMEDIISVRETRNEYRRNSGDANIRFNFGASSMFELGYRHSWLENDDDAIDDGTISDSYASYTYWFNVKHGLEINAGYTKAEFSRDNGADPGDNYSGFTEGIGYRYRSNPNSTFSMDFAFTDRDFEENATDEDDTTDYEVYTGMMGYEKNISEDMSYNISAGYFTRQNDMDEDDNGFNADISLTKNFSRGSFALSGRSGWGEAYLESERRGFTKYQSVTSTFNYQVTENLSNNVSFTYRQDKDESSRKSKSLRTGYGWRWTFSRYYSMSLDYTCAVRDDDEPTGDYLVNRVMFSLRWRKPFR